MEVTNRCNTDTYDFGSDHTTYEYMAHRNFGPIVAIRTFETEQVIDMAGGTEYGLASYFIVQVQVVNGDF